MLYRMITTANLTQLFDCVKLSQQSIRIISEVFRRPTFDGEIPPFGSFYLIDTTAPPDTLPDG